MLMEDFPIHLFNLADDLGEKLNLADSRDQAERIANMKERLLEFDASVYEDYRTHADRGKF